MSTNENNFIEEDDELNSMNGFDEENGSSNLSNRSQPERKSDPENKKQSENKTTSSEHDGKYFVVQKGMCQCNQGFNFPKFKVTSHQKHYWNDEEGTAEYLAVTEDDLTFDPAAVPFGNCKLQPTTGGYLPCSYAPAGKWQKTYEKVKVMGKSCLTEISELQCAVGGKITVLKHGQQSEIGKSHVMKANPRQQNAINPIMNFEEFQEEVNGSKGEAW